MDTFEQDVTKLLGVKIKATTSLAIYTRLVSSDWGSRLREKMHVTLHKIFLDILAVLEKHQYNPKGDTVALEKNYLLKSTLTNCQFGQAIVACQQSDPHFPADMFLPTLRRLAMHNIIRGSLGENTDRAKSWLDFLQSLPKYVGTAITSADEILQDVTAVLWNVPNDLSMRYSPVCASSACRNVETSKKPHKFRCQVCWRFHACSEKCKELGELFMQHECCLISPDDAAAMRKEMEDYFAKDKDPPQSVERPVPERDVCYFCSAQLKHLRMDTMLFCQGCDRVQYCSNECQQWDWQRGGHKDECRKK